MARQAGAARYRVKVGIEYPTDPDVIRRILEGATVPDHARKAKRVEAGAVVDDIPAVSIPWLLDQGLIEPAGAADPALTTVTVTVPDDAADAAEEGGDIGDLLLA